MNYGRLGPEFMPFVGRKLPSSSVLAAIRWTGDDAFWETLRPHIGTIDLETQVALVDVVRAYIHGVEVESNATSIADAAARLKDIRDVAHAFWHVLTTQDQISGERRSSRIGAPPSG